MLEHAHPRSPTISLGRAAQEIENISPFTHRKSETDIGVWLDEGVFGTKIYIGDGVTWDSSGNHLASKGREDKALQTISLSISTLSLSAAAFGRILNLLMAFDNKISSIPEGKLKMILIFRFKLLLTLHDFSIIISRSSSPYIIYVRIHKMYIFYIPPSRTCYYAQKHAYIMFIFIHAIYLVNRNVNWPSV